MLYGSIGQNKSTRGCKLLYNGHPCTFKIVLKGKKNSIESFKDIYYMGVNRTHDKNLNLGIPMWDSMYYTY